MQRRAAAIYVAVFILIGAGSFALLGAAEEPSITIQTAEYEVSSGQTFTHAGVTYTLSEAGDGSATATWTNESARMTETLDNESDVTYQGTNYTLRVASGDSPSSFSLVEKQTVDLPTTEVNNTTYVVVEEQDERRLVPIDEYLPDPEVREFSAGDEFEYDNRTNTIASVSGDGVTLAWTEPTENEVSFESGQNVTLGDTTYLAYVPDGTLTLTQDYGDYQEDVERIDYFHERKSGLWGVTLLSGIAAALFAMLAFMPQRY